MGNNFIQELQSRQLLAQTTTTELPDNCCVYLGFDPTSSSLHIGHLVGLTILRIAKKFDYKTIGLIGSGTALLGDPTWKTEARPMIDPETIKTNAAQIKKQIEQIAGPDHMVDNIDWYSNVNILTFMRDIAAYFSVNQLSTMETFRNRLDQNQHLSFMEFSYPLLQGYDFFYLNEKYGCNLQLGGSDQWGNITQGLHYVAKKANKQVYGITANLLTKANGEKMGKSLGGAVFLNENLVSPFEFWQFFRNVTDADVPKLLTMLTDIPLDEIKELIVDINNAKKVLADYLTTLVHGKDKAQQARIQSEELFEGNQFDNIPIIELKHANNPLDKVLAEVKLYESVGEAKRSIIAGAVQINNEKIQDPQHKLSLGEHLLCLSKKRHVKLKLN